MKLLLFYPDILEAGVGNNWTTLHRRIALEGFPPGRMIGRRRAWKPAEVLAWFDRQPTDNPAQLKGAAKKAKAESAARQEGFVLAPSHEEGLPYGCR